MSKAINQSPEERLLNAIFGGKSAKTIKVINMISSLDDEDEMSFLGHDMSKSEVLANSRYPFTHDGKKDYTKFDFIKYVMSMDEKNHKDDANVVLDEVISILKTFLS